MSVSLLEVMAAASGRLAPLTAECAGHIVLAAADQLALSPRGIDERQMTLEENGVIRIAAAAAMDEGACERSLRRLLDRLMLVARGNSGALCRAGRRESLGDLQRFVRELEAALIPANRAAARRRLAR
jgi:hypothetical protein